MGFFSKIFGGDKKEDNISPKTNQNSSVINENTQSQKGVGITSLSLEKQESLKTLNLRKDMITSLCLEKKELSNLTARVSVVLDFSGSMETLYRNGSVQRIIDRVLPLALKFDDNGELEAWLFSNNCDRINDISVNNYFNYISNEKLLNKYRMGGTNYAPVIEDVVAKYVKEEPSNLPTYVIFITDGDNFDKEKATKAITKASKENIFWQFVGIGNNNFSFLKKLDEMEGRYIDNANFFPVNNLDNMSDEELYSKLLAEYPEWIREATKKGIL